MNVLLRATSFFLSFICLSSLSLRAQTPSQSNVPSETSVVFEREAAAPEEVLFSFFLNFAEARAEQRKNKKTAMGHWKGNGFAFPGFESRPDFFVQDQTRVNGKMRPAIWITVRPGQESALIFSKIPPGRQMRIFYASPDFNFETQGKSPSFIQLQVLIGKKIIFEAQTNTKGWNEKTLDLLLPYLLHRDYQITFRVSSLDPEPRFLVLYGYVQ